MDLNTLQAIIHRLANDLPDVSQEDQMRRLMTILVQHLGFEHVFIAKNSDDIVTASRAYDFYYDNEFIGPMEYSLKDTPCDAVINSQKICHYPLKIQELFPHDDGLKKLKIQGYAGVPVISSSGKSLGHIVLMSSSILKLSDLHKDLLRIFAYKAAYIMENP